MTLLVLDVKLPREASVLDVVELRAALAALGPNFESYVVSFAVLCIFWLGHHRLMHRVQHVDSSFLWLNLLFNLFITFVPFATSLMGAHRDLDDVALVYGANLAAILATQCLMWRHALHTLQGVPAGEAASAWRAIRTRYVAAFGVVALAIVLAVADVPFAIYAYLLFFGLALRPKSALA
jgi:uncharacterized membrane protein